MKPRLLHSCQSKAIGAVSALLLATTGISSAANLMLDFGVQSITSGQETNSPGHATGAIPATETTWNTVTSAAANSSLSFSNGTAATGVSYTMGLESAAGSNTINYSAAGTGINTTAVVGSGNAIGQQNYNGPSSIYGDGTFGPTTTTVSTAGRDGFLGSTGSAIGIRIDGLASGTYTLLAMARNTNTTAATAAPMALYATSTSLQSSLAFGSLTAVSQANTTYSTGDYAGEYNSYTAGENYVSTTVNVAAGQSLYLVVEGSGGETRGFLNSLQIVSVPEPSAVLLGCLGLFGLLRRRRA